MRRGIVHNPSKECINAISKHGCYIISPPLIGRSSNMSSFILLTPTTEQRSSASMLSCPPPPNPPPSIHRLHHCIDMERRPSHTSTMADINSDEGDELVGFILVAPLGSSNNTFVQCASSYTNTEANTMGVSVSPKKVLRPRPSSFSFE